MTTTLKRNTPWRAEEDEKLHAYRKQGLTTREIAPLLDRTHKSVASHWSFLNYDDKRKSELQHRKNMHRRTVFKHEPRREPDVPAEVLAEREARMRAPLSLTAAVFGDPPRGFSSLDRR